MQGQTVDFLLSKNRDKAAAVRFFKQVTTSSLLTEIQTLTIRSSRFCFCPAVTQPDIDQQWRAGFDRDAVDCLRAGIILGELACAARARFLLGLGPRFA